LRSTLSRAGAEVEEHVVDPNLAPTEDSRQDAPLSGLVAPAILPRHTELVELNSPRGTDVEPALKDQAGSVGAGAVFQLMEVQVRGNLSRRSGSEARRRINEPFPEGEEVIRREAEPGDELVVGEDGVTAHVVDLPFG